MGYFFTDYNGLGGGYDSNLVKALKIIGCLYLNLRTYPFRCIKSSFTKSMISASYILTPKSVIIRNYSPVSHG